MVVDLNVVGAKTFYEGVLVQCGISVDEGKIEKVGKESSLPKSDRTLDVRGMLVLPGLIDVHVHLRDMELSYKEDFHSGTASAAAGGFTTVVDMPNTSPPTDSSERLRIKIEKAQRRILTNVGFYGALHDKEGLVEEMVKEGAIGFKLNLLDPLADLDVYNVDALTKALRAVRRGNSFVVVHAEDLRTVREITDRYRRLEDFSLRAFLKAHSSEAEQSAIRRVLELQNRTGARLHIAHVTTSSSIDFISKAKSGGGKVTCEVTPHHLMLTEEDLLRIGGKALTVPPLRSKADRARLWKALIDGDVDVVASDHAPHALSEKSDRDVWAVKPGIPGLETTLSLMMTRFHGGDLTIERMVRLLAEGPAKVLELKDAGRIEKGFRADLVVVDVKKRYKIDSSTFQSKAHYSPFDGLEVRGKPVKTLVNGIFVVDEGEIVAGDCVGEVLGRATS